MLIDAQSVSRLFFKSERLGSKCYNLVLSVYKAKDFHYEQFGKQASVWKITQCPTKKGENR